MQTPLLLYRDDELLVLAKPAGLATHPGRGAGTGSALALARGLAGRWVHAAHRLDRATSGALAFALSPEAAARLGAAFASGAVGKRYVAIVRGHAPDAGVIDRALRDEDSGKMRDAVTRYRTLARTVCPWSVRPFPTARYSFVELTPETGRTHQLRRHLAGLGHPIVGDTKHGDLAHNRAFAEATGVRRLLLHAQALTLPAAHGAVTVEAGLDDAFTAALRVFQAGTGCANLDSVISTSQ